MLSVRDVSAQIADNWPAFVYILLMVAFSICFFIENRAEALQRMEMSERLHDHIRERFDRLETLIRKSRTAEACERLPTAHNSF